MNQRVLYYFDIMKDQAKYFSFGVLPGTTWDEIQSALDEFKAEFETMKQAALEKEREAKEAESNKTEVAKDN